MSIHATLTIHLDQEAARTKLTAWLKRPRLLLDLRLLRIETSRVGSLKILRSPDSLLADDIVDYNEFSTRAGKKQAHHR